MNYSNKIHQNYSITEQLILYINEILYIGMNSNIDIGYV